jgi:hypothetical protein
VIYDLSQPIFNNVQPWPKDRLASMTVLLGTRAVAWNEGEMA